MSARRTQLGLCLAKRAPPTARCRFWNVANTLVMIATAPMLSAILSTIFLKENPDKKTWVAIIITFISVLYIFFDSIKIGNFYGDILGLIAALGLAIGAVIIRSGKKLNLVPSAVIGKLLLYFSNLTKTGRSLSVT